MSPQTNLIDGVRIEQDVLRRTVLASDVFRRAEDQVRGARRQRDQALYSYAKIDNVRPSDIERATGVSPSMTNYATTRAAVNRTLRIEQPVETIRAACERVDHWESIRDEAEQIRDDGIAMLAVEGRWSPQDLAGLLGVTASRISQIGGGPLSHGRSAAPRTSLRLASLGEIGEELSRRAELVGARDQEGGESLVYAAGIVTGVSKR